MTAPIPGGLNGFAIDLGGTKIAAAHLADGSIRLRKQVATDSLADATGLLGRIESLLTELGYDGHAPMGCAVSGRIDTRGMWYAVNSTTLPSVRGFPLRQALSHRFGGPVSLMNDAVAAALGEARFGAGRGVDSLGYITVSTGIGGGIVLDGKPLISSNGLAGHVGFTSLRQATGRCGSGRVGTVESVASGRAIARAAELAGYAGLDAKGVFSFALNGEAWASAIIRRSAGAISELCANLVAILGLERIVIGGSIGLAKGYAGLVRECLSNEPVLFNTGIVEAGLGQNSALYGALSIAVSDGDAL